MNGFWLISGIILVLVILLIIGWYALFFHIKERLYPHIVRIFQEKPLFIVPQGKPVDYAESVDFQTEDGLTLRGCYLPTSVSKRQGVILFGIEFGSNRWACVPYCQFLLDAGYDIFAFEYRNQGDSDKQSGYEPLQWVTSYEVKDFEAAIHYLKNRPDADPRGIGFFGISKGGSAGLFAAAKEKYVRCVVTDGMFATRTTMLPYMRRWVAIYSSLVWVQTVIPDWYYLMFARLGLKQIEKERNCRFVHLEPYLKKLTPRPLLMIQGEKDTYIKPEMAHTLFDRVREPKEFWLVKGAKHNQAFQIAQQEYQDRVLRFFETHLGNQETGSPSVNGSVSERSEVSPLMADR